MAWLLVAHSTNIWPVRSCFFTDERSHLPRPEVVLGRLTKYTPSHLPASMTPEQAVAAGVVLGAKAVCPIHYGLDVELYREYPHALQNFISAAQKRDLPVVILQPGEEVHWDRA